MAMTRREILVPLIAAPFRLAGCKPEQSSGGERKAAGKQLRIGLVYFAPEEGAELCMTGLYEGLAERGFERGRNLEVLTAHAQGEIANVPMLLQNYDSQNLDLI